MSQVRCKAGVVQEPVSMQRLQSNKSKSKGSFNRPGRDICEAHLDPALTALGHQLVFFASNVHVPTYPK